MNKPKLWQEKDLKGIWDVTRKLDGVRMLRDEDGNPVSRNGKPLYNLEGIPADITDAEIFIDNWETTVSRVRSHNGEPVPAEAAYTIEPLDPRLYLKRLANPTVTTIKEELTLALARGEEGLVLRQGDKWLKVKPKETYDVEVTGATEGKGKFAGQIGALITPMGNVSGFNDYLRREFTKELPKLIEVEAMGLTPRGKFRHPRFVRVRFDK